MLLMFENLYVSSFIFCIIIIKQFCYTHNVTRINESDACRQVTRKDMSFEFRAKRSKRTAEGREFQIFGAAERNVRESVTAKTEG
jgi:hypothetical protein